jgi:hypothetical protein
MAKRNRKPKPNPQWDLLDLIFEGLGDDKIPYLRRLLEETTPENLDLIVDLADTHEFSFDSKQIAVLGEIVGTRCGVIIKANNLHDTEELARVLKMGDFVALRVNDIIQWL